MGKYIVKRVLLAIVTIWAVATITFFLMNMVPGGPFMSEKAISPAAQAALEAKYGLDKPLFQQYITYITDALHGDFGDSLRQRGRTVASIIGTKFPVSAKVGGISVLVALCIGIPLGCIAAYRRGKFIDNFISVVSTCGIAVPSFVICTVLMYAFGVKLKWLPILGLTGWKNYIMPVAALAFYPTAYIMRLMRSSMLDVLGQDYMRTAKAKGLSQKVSLFKHALRNAILPVITYVGPMLAYTLTGSFIVEKIFTIPGLGGEFIGAITSRDYTLIMGTTIFLATLLIIMNVIVDIVYKIVDPRIKLK
ncbi:MAG: ABC transporter permease [Clostridiales bacterium]|nr:ABC transporter permease [Roseburia sp.]MDD7638454.1 ABC transporter permease [Clostridiales bacterium]MDY4112988.1 ABC transporter permease [Roseburia sp.]